MADRSRNSNSPLASEHVLQGWTEYEPVALDSDDSETFDINQEPSAHAQHSQPTRVVNSGQSVFGHPFDASQRHASLRLQETETYTKDPLDINRDHPLASSSSASLEGSPLLPPPGLWDSSST